MFFINSLLKTHVEENSHVIEKLFIKIKLVGGKKKKNLV